MSQRGSSRVGRLEDEQRQHEVQGLVDGAPVEERSQSRRQETAGPGEPDTDPGRRPLTAMSDDSEPSIDEKAQLADFAAWMKGAWFPATAGALVGRLEAAYAPRWIVDRVRELPSDLVVETPTAAWSASR